MPRIEYPSVTKSRELAARIDYYRHLKKISLADLSDAAGITGKTMSIRRSNPDDFRISELRAISRKLGISFEALMGFKPME